MIPQFYIVGGFVRDTVMGKTPKDRDWVVVGATPEWMLANGYKQVGADFPVFLKDGEEFALARTERKTGPGYNGFETQFSPEVTLVEDLSRRDLTMNAMAMAQGAEHIIIDPFGGQEDIRCGIMRHVSEAFAEDPVRVLRVARFAARYGFEIAEETYALCDDIVASGELNNLTRERTTQELMKVMEEDGDINKFFAVLEEINSNGVGQSAKSIIWPELDECGVHGETFTKVYPNLSARGKFTMVVEHMGEKEIKDFVEKNKFPTEFATFAVMTMKMTWVGLNHDAKSIVEFMTRQHIYNNPEVMMAIVKDFPGFEQFARVYEKTKHINFESLSAEQKATLKGAAIGEAITAQRIAIVS